MENILSHFDESQNKKDLINTNLNFLEAIVPETIHEDQMKNIDLEIKQYQMLKDVIKFKGNDRLTAKELYNLMYKCLPQEYKANISAFYEMVELCNYMNTKDPSLGFKKMPLKLKALIMLRGHIYNFEDNHNLSPVEKFYNITGQRERKEEILTNVNLSEYDKIMFGFPVPETTKQKVLKIKEGDDITNIFTK